MRRQKEEMNMTQIYSFDVVLKNTAEAVIAPLKDAISSLNTVYEALIKADVDPVTGQCSTYDYIRQQIVQAHKNMEQSEHLASLGLKSLDENLERFTQDVRKLECEKNSTNTQLQSLRTEQASHQNLLEYSQGTLEQARRNLNSIKETQRKKRKAKLIRRIGVGLVAGPAVGLATGAIMMIGDKARRRQAACALGEAEEEVSKCDSEVKKYERIVYEYQFKISQTYLSIEQKDSKLKQMHEGIQKARKEIESVAEFQKKVRSAVGLLGVLSGRATVAEHQTRKFILQESVMKVMDDVMNAVKEITGNQLHYNNDLPRLIRQMKENSQQLEALCASENYIQHGYSHIFTDY